MPLVNGPIDWSKIDLVIFDVDGTLYDQRRLRARMLLAIMAATLKTRSLLVSRAIRQFRISRESLADALSEEALERPLVVTAANLGLKVETVARLVHEWLEVRPLPYLARCRFKGLNDLFRALANVGKKIAVLSDYPVHDKLAALGLQADILVSAADVDVRMLKPHPKGVMVTLGRAGVPASRALLIGDRVERDWQAASQAGVRALIRSRHPHPQVDTFAGYCDEPFHSILSSIKAEDLQRSAQTRPADAIA